jgi:hypothetical protein
MRKFQDVEITEFRMSHSSKTALAFAKVLDFPEIVAVGFSPVLREAIARGATSCISVPLCEDPLEQASFFPKGEFSHVIVGENPEWVFTGASLAGIISESRNLRFELFKEGDSTDFPESSVILIKDSGESALGVDIKRIKDSFEAPVNPEAVLGGSTLLKREQKKGESLTGEAKEIASTLQRKIRRLSSV